MRGIRTPRHRRGGDLTWLGVWLALTISGAAHGQEEISATLEGVRAYALAHHPRLAAARAERSAAAARIVPAQTLPDPMLGLSVRSMEGEAGLGVSQMFPLAGKRRLKGEVAMAEAQATAAMAEGVGREVVMEATTAFAEWWFGHQAIRTAEEQLKLFQQLEAAALARYRVGEAPFAEVVRAQLEVGRAEDELRTLTELLTASAARLNAAMGRGVGEPLPPPADPPSVEWPEGQGPETATLAGHPEILALTHLQQAAEQRLALARRNRVPDLTVGLEFMRNSEMGRSGLGVMAGINLPIWRDCCHNEVREAAAEVAAAAALVADKHLQLQSAAEQVRFRLRDARRKVALLEQRLLPQVEQALLATLTAYRSGEASLVELLDTARLGQELRLQLARARADGVSARGELERLFGGSGVAGAVSREEGND